MHDNFLEELRSYCEKTNEGAFQLWQDGITYDITVDPEQSVGRNTQTGEEYEVYLTSVMKHTGPGGH